MLATFQIQSRQSTTGNHSLCNTENTNCFYKIKSKVTVKLF